MFDFLNKLSHQHPPKSPKASDSKQELQKSSPPHSVSQSQFLPMADEQPKNKTVVVQKQKKSVLSKSAQIQEGDKAALDPQTMGLFQVMAEKSSNWVDGLCYSMIREAKANIERKVYLREMSNQNQQYLEEILIQSSSHNPYVRYALNELVNNSVYSIMADIENTDKYEINRKGTFTKDDMRLLRKSIDQIRSKQGTLKEKVGELKMQLQYQSSKMDQKAQDIITKRSFSVNDPKTKKTEEFIKNIQFNRQLQRQKYIQYLQGQKKREKIKNQKFEVQKQKAKSERHERLVQAYHIKRKIKEDQFKQSQQRAKDFRKYVKVHESRKPLFKEKEEKYYQNVILKDEQDRLRKLILRKQEYIPIDHENIEDHEERYFEIRKQNQKKRRVQKRMRLQAQEERRKQFDDLHKGEFRYFVLEDILKKKQSQSIDPRKQLRVKKAREKAYSQNVKIIHKPKVDETKRIESEGFLSPKGMKKKYVGSNRMKMNEDGQFINYSLSNIKGYETVDNDPKLDGQKNRRFLKQYLRDKAEMGLVKKSEQNQKSVKTIEPKPNYLEEMRKHRQSSSIRKAETIDEEIKELKDKHDLSYLRVKVQQYDQRAKWLQKKLKNSKHKPEEQAKLQDDYLFSVKAKMELVKYFD